MPKNKILILDGKLDDIRAMEELLKNEGYELTVSSDGVDGLNKAYVEFPDLIILDLVLPVLDGFEVCSSLKQSERCKNIHIIIATAREELASEGMKKIGADDFILKPFTEEMFLKKVKAVLAKSK
ncbi:response regulator [Candidatus Oleimmundimicrobium sp.]|uniref:response regulator n=1 Tax=Candidatus Oleimmundimicrobium sp. TaxID=3060597 RepID=UPI002722E75D|nr:response regulator [Candidatus Oleimmundimicrobium sp.]MDO8886546.1 response regulator [Candidatus Oleimmundimicrobium sp.]